MKSSKPLKPTLATSQMKAFDLPFYFHPLAGPKVTNTSIKLRLISLSKVWYHGIVLFQKKKKKKVSFCTVSNDSIYGPAGICLRTFNRTPGLGRYGIVYTHACYQRHLSSFLLAST